MIPPIGHQGKPLRLGLAKLRHTRRAMPPVDALSQWRAAGRWDSLTVSACQRGCPYCFFRVRASRWFAQMQKMEDYMTDLTHYITDKMPRRGFFGRFAGAMVLAGLATTPVRAESTAAPSEGPDWPGVLKGRHRQVVDAYEA